MIELKISNFNLALFQRPKKPLPDDQFREIYETILPYFPLVDQLSNPILTARRKEGGEIFVNPAFIQFMNIETKDIHSDTEITKHIAALYFSKYNTQKIHQIAIRFVSIIEANFTDGKRQLIKNESFALSSNNTNVLNSEEEVKVGIRVVFRRNSKNYDLRIEPYFKNLDCNYVDFNVVIPKLEISLEDSYKSVYEEMHFFTKKISTLIP